MGTFTTKLELGEVAFGVQGHLDPCVVRLTVGQVRIEQTHPKGRLYDTDGCYKEVYMCFETGVGSGALWTYGKDIFATEAAAQRGVIEHQQAAYKEQALRDEQRAKDVERQRAADLATLQRLQAQYGQEAAACLITTNRPPI